MTQLKSTMTRGNKTIWRVAEWIFNECIAEKEYGETRDNYLLCEELSDRSIRYREEMYDKAAELMKKIQLNEFTGEDSHGD